MKGTTKDKVIRMILATRILPIRVYYIRVWPYVCPLTMHTQTGDEGHKKGQLRVRRCVLMCVLICVLI